MNYPRYLGREGLRKTTAPKLLCDNAKFFPQHTAYSVVEGSYLVARSWQDYATRVTQAARSMEQYGVGAGERVVIFADLCEEWLICDMAAQALGAIVCGIYPTSSKYELGLLLKSCDPILALAGSPEQAMKLAHAHFTRQSPGLKILLISAGGAEADLEHLVPALAAPNGGDLDWLWSHVLQVKPEMPAFIVFTSGTGGDPKGALVSHGKHLAAASTMVDHFGLLRSEPHVTAVYLPPCHVLGRNFAITLPLIAGLRPVIGGLAAPLPALLRHAKPTIMLFVPRILQKFATQVIGEANARGKISRWLLGLTTAESSNRRWAVASNAILNRVVPRLISEPLLKRIGFDRLELVISGGAAISPATMTFWHRLGVNVIQGYGTTESARSVISAQVGRFPKPGTIGIAPAGTDIKLDGNGEILVRQPDMFEGYWNDDEATRSVLSADGWLRTGDVGRWENGELVLVDRARDFIVTSGGKTIAPSFVESALRGSSFVAEAVVFGHGRKYLTALLEPDFDAIESWLHARGHRIEGPVVESAAVKDLMREQVSIANAQLARVQQVKDFRLIPRALQPGREGDPITATRKVRRSLMYRSFQDLVEDMYCGDIEEHLIASATRLPIPESAVT